METVTLHLAWFLTEHNAQKDQSESRNHDYQKWVVHFVAVQFVVFQFEFLIEQIKCKIDLYQLLDREEWIQMDELWMFQIYILDLTDPQQFRL